MRRSLYFLLTLALVSVLLIGCGSASPAPGSSPESKPPADSGQANPSQQSTPPPPAPQPAPEPTIPEPSPAENTPRSDAWEAYIRTDKGEGEVLVDVTYAPPEYFALIDEEKEGEKLGAGRKILFLVQFETHSVDLSAYDLTKLSSLRIDGGKALVPEGWVSISDDSHHRAGVLRFPGTGSDGVPVITPQTNSLRLVIRDIAGVEVRAFEWSLPLK